MEMAKNREEMVVKRWVFFLNASFVINSVHDLEDRQTLPCFFSDSHVCKIDKIYLKILTWKVPESC